MNKYRNQIFIFLNQSLFKYFSLIIPYGYFKMLMIKYFAMQSMQRRIKNDLLPAGP